MWNREANQPSALTFGSKGSAIDLSGGDASLGARVKAVVVTSEGTVSYRPYRENAGSINFGNLPVGYVLPHIPGLILKSGTTAELATVED